MLKRIIGGAMITAAAVFALPYSPINMEKNESLIVEKNQQETIAIPPGQVPVKLVETVDGDTIKVRMNGKLETIRYLLVDTPESKKPGMCVQPYAKEAFLRNNELVKAGRITLEFEEGDNRDSYGRLLAYVFVYGDSVQEKLLNEGFARVAYIMHPPYKYLNLFRKDENTAKRNRLNIWSRPSYVSYKGFIGCVPFFGS